MVNASARYPSTWRYSASRVFVAPRLGKYTSTFSSAPVNTVFTVPMPNFMCRTRMPRCQSPAGLSRTSTGPSFVGNSGSRARDGAVLDRISPIHRVDRIRAPLFVIHGANDPRVPVTEAEQIVAALRQRQHRVEYLRFENEGHGVARRENRIRAYGDVVRFFDDVLGRR